MKPKIFVGSSTEGLDVARAVELQLEHDAELTVWEDGVFGLGRGTLESLVLALNEFDFAILVLTSDDMIVSRGSTSQSPRDNVLLELGLFIGSLGRERTFIVFNRDADIKLPSDLAGVSMADYGDRQDNNLRAALGPACTKMRYAIKSHGSRPAQQPIQSLNQRNSRPFITAKVTTYAEGNISTVLNLTVQNTGTSPAKNVRLSTNEAELKAAFASITLNEPVVNCFTEKGMIPILENGHHKTNSFGVLHKKPEESTWKLDALLNITILYQDLDGNEYKHEIPLKVASDTGFAGSWWAQRE